MFGSPNYYSSYPWNNYGTQNNVAQHATQSNTINWVQGEAGAKAFMIAPGQSVLLMDSESNSFFIKSSDASGMPLPLRVFDYVERTVTKSETASADYVTREEFEKRLSELSNAKSSVPAA